MNHNSGWDHNKGNSTKIIIESNVLNDDDDIGGCSTSAIEGK